MQKQGCIFNTILGLCIVLAVGVFLSGCGGGQQIALSPNQIVANAIEKSDSYQTYYMKRKMKSYKNQELIRNAIIQEWHDKNGPKAKSVSKSKNGDLTKMLTTGNKFLIYTKINGKETAYKATAEGLKKSGFMQGSQKEQMKSMLKYLKEEHDIKVVGKEEIAGRSTYHIKAIPKEENTFTGKQEIWIDQQTWLPLKMISTSGDIKFVLETKEVKFDPEFKDDIFTLDLPDDVEVKNMEDMNPTEEVNVAEAEKALGQPFLKVDSDDYHLQKIELLQMESADHLQITLRYQKDHAPQFRISITPTSEEQDEDNPLFDKAETVTIRGNIQAKYLEDLIHNMIWNEDGLHYSMFIDNPDVKRKEVVKIVNNMVLTHKQDQ